MCLVGKQNIADVSLPSMVMHVFLSSNGKAVAITGTVLASVFLLPNIHDHQVHCLISDRPEEQHAAQQVKDAVRNLEFSEIPCYSCDGGDDTQSC